MTHCRLRNDQITLQSCNVSCRRLFTVTLLAFARTGYSQGIKAKKKLLFTLPVRDSMHGAKYVPYSEVFMICEAPLRQIGWKLEGPSIQILRWRESASEETERRKKDFHLGQLMKLKGTFVPLSCSRTNQAKSLSIIKKVHLSDVCVQSRRFDDQY